MMSCVILFLVTISAYFADSSDEFVTIWTPNVINSKRNFNIAFSSSEIDKDVEISFKMCNLYSTLELTGQKPQTTVFKTNQQISGAKNAEINILLHRNETNSTGIRQMCMSQTINNVKIAKKQFNAFIQTDKPIYKPVDEVRFRIIVVDNSLMPYYLNNLQINIFDPQGRSIKEINELGENFVGVYSGNFSLSNEAQSGVWKIKAVVDKHHQWMVSKKFGVAKFKLPKLTAHITLKDNHLFHGHYRKDDLHISIYAQNNIGDFIRGSAQLTITCTSNDQVVLNRNFSDFDGIHYVKYNVQDDLKYSDYDFKLDYEARIMFTEAKSGFTANKTVKFTVHAYNHRKIRVDHPDKFLPGLPFEIKVWAYGWKETLIQSSPEPVSIICFFKSKGIRIVYNYFYIKNGVAVHNLLVPQDTEKLDVQVSFLEDRYERRIEKGAVDINKLVVDYLPKLPNSGDTVTIYVRADSEIDDLVVLVTPRFTYFESPQVHCNFRHNCEFNITLRMEMFPSAKVSVYRVQNSTRIDQGEVTIISNGNTLDIEIPNLVETSNKTEITITTAPESTVYLLGFDKRLLNFFQGNEITKDDIFSEFADKDRATRVTVLDMNKSNWNDCTELELQQLEKGRQYMIPHYWSFPAEEYEDEITCHEDNTFEELPKSDNSESIELPDIEEDFREVWIFEALEVPDGSLTKSFYVPNSINTLMVSSFSIHDVYGLVIGPPKEIIVKYQFYIHALMPSAIKLGEIAKADVMIYNYVESKEALNVKVAMYFQKNINNFKFYDSKDSSRNRTRHSTTINVPYNDARKITFYFQSSLEGGNFEGKTMIVATATNRLGKQFVVKKLRVLQILE